MNSEGWKAAVTGDEPVLVVVHPGTGVVDRSGDVLLVIPTVGPAQSGRVQQLLELWHRPGSLSDHQREQILVTELERPSGERLPGMAVVQGIGGELTVLAYGDVEVTVDGLEQQRFLGTHSAPWTSRRLPGRVRLLQVRAAGTPALPPPGTMPYHLRAGTVPGSGVTLHRVSLTPIGVAGPQDAPPQATVARKAVTFASVLISGLAGQPQTHRPPLPIEDDADQPEPAPEQHAELVEALECPAGHVNDPNSRRCATCGAALDRIPGRIVRRPRPSLGVLVTDTGSVFALTGGYVIGRAPERDEAVLSGRAKALVLRDVGQSVSRVHVQLDISGWRVLVTDRGSANGTFLKLPSPGAAWERIAAGSPTLFPPGARLRIGGRQLLFESYREDATFRAGRS